MEIVTLSSWIIALLYLWINYGYYLIFFISGKLGYDYVSNYKYDNVVNYVNNFQYTTHSSLALYVIAKSYLLLKYVLTKIKYYLALLADYLMKFELTQKIYGKLEETNKQFLEYKKKMTDYFLNETEIGKEIEETDKKFHELKTDIEEIEKIMKMVSPVLHTIEKVDNGINSVDKGIETFEDEMKKMNPKDLLKELENAKNQFEQLFKKHESHHKIK